MQASTLLAAIALAMMHLLAGKMRFLDRKPRSVWLSAAGGISVAYVFLHLLPELAKGQIVIRESVPGALEFLEHHVYFVSFIGLTIFYGLERLAKLSRRHQQDSGIESIPSPGVFWLHVGSFFAYNTLVGYLLVNSLESRLNLFFFSLAMAVHFLVIDFGLYGEYKQRYTNAGRWLLGSAVLFGWAIGRTLHIPEVAISLLTAFLAGGVILNVLKEELPEERESRFGAFLLGGVCYTALLVAL